jgi:hypothetical protein
MIRPACAAGALAATVTLAVLAGAGMRPQAALADGDPASDVLVYQPVFFPYRPAPRALERRLTGLVKSANQQGYRIRIAIVQSPRDLGSVPMLFGRPSVYARFLSSELSSVWRDRVLIVMPNGYGLAQGAHLVRVGGVERIKENTTTGPDEAVLRHLARPAASTPAALVAAATHAVQALAARHDIALTAASAAPPADGGGSASGGSTALAAAVSATVGLAAGLLWYLWRSRPRRSTG